MSMTDTQLLDYCEAVMKRGKDDARYPDNYTFMLGTMTFNVSNRDPSTFRESVEAHLHKTITERLMK